MLANVALLLLSGIASAYTIQGNLVVTGNISAGSVNTSQINTGAIAADAVINSKMLTGSVDTRVLATDAVSNAKVLTGAVDTRAIATDSVSNAKLLNAAVQTSKVAADAVTTTAIINSAVNTAKHATDSVTSTAILNASVQTSKLAADAVTSAAIENGQVTSGKLGSGLTVNVSSLTVNGYNVLGVWYSYTPTLSCGSGSLATSSAVGRYMLTGKSLTLSIGIIITDKGTCASGLFFNLPASLIAATTPAGQSLSGFEISAVGWGVGAYIMASGTSFELARTSDGSTSSPVTNGYSHILNGVIQVQ